MGICVNDLRQARGTNLQIEHLEDAEGAGGGNAAQCTLIVTEGHSAKTSAVAGLEVGEISS